MDVDTRRSSLDPSTPAGAAALQVEQFDASSYINDRLKGVRMGDEARRLQTIRAELATLHSASAETLRNNVFQNFEQFIDAAKEISHVEQEVYQLSALLTEQKSLIEGLMGMTTDDKASIHTASSTSTFSAAANTTQLLLNRIDGIAAVLNAMKPTEKVLFQGDVTLLDPDTKQRKQRAYFVLLPDKLLVAAQHPQQPSKFILESTLPLNSIAAVNVRDRESGGGDSAGLVIKLLIFPDQRYYRCDTPRAKQQWLDEIEGAKKAQLKEGGLQRQATIRGRRRTAKEVAGSIGGGGGLPMKTIPDEASDLEGTQELNEEMSQWLADLPAELDDCLAHRDLEQAVELICEWKETRGRDAAADAQIILRENTLVQILSDEVRRPGSTHGGPKSMHRARATLSRLGRGSYAVDLFLQQRSTMLRAAYKDVTVSEEPLAHVRALTARYLPAVDDTVEEFRHEPEYWGQVLHFCSHEMAALLSLVRKHVIEVVPSMTVLSRTWKILMNTAQEMTARGMQVTFEVHRLLGPAMEEAIADNFDQIIHAFRHRLAEENWSGAVLESEAALNRMMEEYSDLDLQIDWARSGATTMHISEHVLEAAKMALRLCTDLAPLRSSPLAATCDHDVEQLWTEFLAMFTGVENEPTALAYSANFVLTQVLPLCEVTYYEPGEEILPRMLRSQFAELEKYCKPSGMDDDGAARASEEEEEEVATC